MSDHMKISHRSSRNPEPITKIEGLEVASDDLKNVSEWLNCNPDDVVISIASEPINLFEETIKQNISSYDEFPEDFDRMERIEKLLLSGHPPYPVFVEKGDKEMFVMEGRHRIVAFSRVGITRIPVAYCSPKPVSRPKNKPR